MTINFLFESFVLSHRCSQILELFWQGMTKSMLLFWQVQLQSLRWRRSESSTWCSREIASCAAALSFLLQSLHESHAVVTFGTQALLNRQGKNGGDAAAQHVMDWGDYLLKLQHWQWSIYWKITSSFIDYLVLKIGLSWSKRGKLILTFGCISVLYCWIETENFSYQIRNQLNLNDQISFIALV